MTVGPYVPPARDPVQGARELEAFKARIGGKTIGEALAIRLDLQEQISHFDGAANEWHDGQLRDEAMCRLARLRREFAYITAEIERGTYVSAPRRAP